MVRQIRPVLDEPAAWPASRSEDVTPLLDPVPVRESECSSGVSKLVIPGVTPRTHDDEVLAVLEQLTAA